MKVMDEQLIAENNKILELGIGSYLYGTNIDTSDKDYLGIFMPNIEYVLGFKTCEEVTLNIIDKNKDGKNTQKALDRKFYEFRKYITLAFNNNPNILETLFVNQENIIFINDIGKELLNIKHLFPYKGLKERFLGYAFAQKHKMIIRKDNYFDLISGLDYLSKFDCGKTLLEILLTNNCPPFLKIRYDGSNNISFIEIGDLNLMPHTPIKRVKIILEERLSKVGNRKELLTKYGYDCKFGMHLIRLMLEGVELLKTGELKFPLKEAQMLKDIREGKWKIEDILNCSQELEREIEDLTKNSKLPNKPNIEEIEKFTISKLKTIL